MPTIDQWVYVMVGVGRCLYCLSSLSLSLVVFVVVVVVVVITVAIIISAIISNSSHNTILAMAQNKIYLMRLRSKNQKLLIRLYVLTFMVKDIS